MHLMEKFPIYFDSVAEFRLCLMVFCFFGAERSDRNICLYHLLCIVGNQLRDRLAGSRALAVSKITLAVASLMEQLFLWI